MNPTCIAFVKAVISLSGWMSLSTESGKTYSGQSPSQTMISMAGDINTKDSLITDMRTKLAACLKASPEILK